MYATFKHFFLIKSNIKVLSMFDERIFIKALFIYEFELRRRQKQQH